MADTDTQPGGQPEGQFAIQRIYTKDISFETPHSPAIFRMDWKPGLDVELGSEASAVGDDVYEVVLTVTATVKVQEETAFLAEVKQAGLFRIKGLPEEQMGPMLGAFCPNILFPYVRELISDLTGRGGFPPLYLTPVNFDAIYAERMRRQQGAGEA